MCYVQCAHSCFQRELLQASACSSAFKFKRKVTEHVLQDAKHRSVTCIETAAGRPLFDKVLGAHHDDDDHVNQVETSSRKHAETPLCDPFTP
jgi:hypothetical protein